MDDLSSRVIELEVKTEANSKRIDAIEKERNELNKAMQNMALAIEKLANEQKHGVDEQRKTTQAISELQKDVTKIKLEPAENAKIITREILKITISTIVGLVVGALFALIIK